MKRIVPLAITLLLFSSAVARAVRNLPPYMSWQEDTRTTVTLAWERALPGRGTVHYGTTTNLGQTLHNGDCVRRHAFTLRELQPGTRYHYRVESDDGYVSPIHHFKTAPTGATGSYRVAVFADTQQPVVSGPPWVFDPATNHSKVISLVTNRAPDFYIVVGDLVWDNDWWLWEDWFEREKELLARAPIMPVMGNHEYFTNPHDGSHFFGLFNVPPEPGRGRYYDYTYGHSHFIALNSEDDPAGQRDFLAHSLQGAANNTNILWTFVYWHRTVYTWTDKHARYQPAYSNFVPLISMYGADVVFSGHNHLYERSGPNRGAYYITTGGGGGNPTSPQGVPVGVVSSTAYHVVELDFNGPVLSLEALRWDGTLMDSLTLTNRGRIVRVAPAFPQAGQPVRITYDADLGPLAGATQIHLHLGIDAFTNAVLDAPMTNEAGSGRWFIDTVVPPAATQRIAFVFRNENNVWHSNHTFGEPALPLNWQALLAAPTNAPPAAPALPVVVPGSPVITGGGGSPNNTGDNFDFNLTGGALTPLQPQTGFGTFGRLYFNYDATNLYLGGLETFLSSSSTNNALALFIGVDTLSDNAFTLWHKSGPPQLLDYLHNLTFTEPMDIAILYGDEYGDGAAFTNFSFGAEGYNFGQGVFYIGTNSGGFFSVPGARLSQFDGTNQIPTASANDDGNRRTDRWECAIPWTALNAPAGARSIDCLTVAGVLVSRSTNGTDRYLSGVVVGARAYGAKDGNDNYAYNMLTLTPTPVLMPWADYTFNGLPNGWSHQHFGDALAPAPDEDPDDDGYDNRHEYIANTQPTNEQSLLEAEIALASGGLEVRWPAAGDRAYDVLFTTNLTQPAGWLYLTNAQPTAGPQVLPIAPPPADAGAFYLRARIPD